MRPFLPRRRLLPPLLFLLSLASSPDPTSAQAEDRYCGANWLAAEAACSDPCPNNLDSECDAAAGESCYEYTGCAFKIANATPKPTQSPTKSTPPPTTSPTTSPPTLSFAPTFTPPTQLPTGSPTIWRPDLFHVETMQVDDEGGSTILSTASQRSYGVIFDVETTPNSPAVSISGFEFYSPLKNANVAYEVWTKSGTWHGFEGRERKFRKVAGGNVTTSDAERGLTRLPRRPFAPIKIDGGGARQSIYLTLTSKHLLYAHSATGSETEAITSIEEAKSPVEDTIVLLQSQELIVYEGAAVMMHPFNKATQRIFYRMPRGFVGRIWYERRPCEDVPVTVALEDGTMYEEYRRVQRWEDCEDVKAPGRMPSRVEGMPSSFLAMDGAQSTPSIEGSGNAPTSSTNGTVPTLAPTNSSMPTVLTMKVNLILTLRDFPSSEVMNSEQRAAFEGVAVDFFEGQELLDSNEVELYGAKVYYQQMLTEGGVDEEEGKGRLIDGTSSNGRMLQEGATEADFTGTITTASSVQPAIAEAAAAEIATERIIMSLEVTLVVSILYSPLPQQITQELLQTLLVNNADDFLGLLKRHPALISNLRTVANIPSVLAVAEITEPPTTRPTSAPSAYADSLAARMVALEPDPIPGWVYAVAVFLLLYASLASTSFCYVSRARERMLLARERRTTGRTGNESAGAREGHGMRYDDDGTNSAYSRKSGASRKSKGVVVPSKGLFGVGRKKKKKMDDRERARVYSEMNGTEDAGRGPERYEEGRGSTEEENNNENFGSSYFSEVEEDGGEGEEMSSIEDSYFSEEEGSYYSEESSR